MELFIHAIENIKRTYKKFRILTILAIIFLCLNIKEPMKALSFATISLSNTSSVTSGSGYVGDTQTISLSSGSINTTYTFYWASTLLGHTVVLGTCTTSNSGTTCNTNFTLPHASMGSWVIHVESSGGSGLNQITETINPEITSISNTSGMSGSTLTITGTGFTSELISVMLGSNIFDTEIPSSGAGGSSGDLSVTSTVPSLPKGTYAVSAIGILAGSISSSYSYTIEPSISLSAGTGLPGVPILLSGSGFSALSTITIEEDGSNTATTTLSLTNGSFISLGFTPSGGAGVYTINATDANGNTATAITYTIEGFSMMSPASTSLGSFTLAPSIGTNTGSLGNIAIVDTRLLSPGWTDTVIVSDFTSTNAHTIPSTNLSVNPNNNTFSAITGSLTNVSPGSSHTFTSTTDVATILSAPSGFGTGSYTINPALSLSIPVGTYAGSYTATIVETLQ